MSEEKQNAGLPVSLIAVPEGLQGTGSRDIPPKFFIVYTSTGEVVRGFFNRKCDAEAALLRDFAYRIRGGYSIQELPADPRPGSPKW